MVLTERQKDILGKTIFEYIEQADPISSAWLEQRYDMGVSPATIRSELLALNEEGYLLQPHTSSGRVPTDKGYRFFVDEHLVGEEELDQNHMQATACSALLLAYYRNTLWKEGWEQVLQEPEFGRSELVRNFTQFIADTEKNIKRMGRAKSIKIYIGKENPFSRIDDFSMIVCECSFDGKQASFVALAGPKRMPYHRHVGRIRSFVNIWKKKLKR